MQLLRVYCCLKILSVKKIILKKITILCKNDRDTRRRLKSNIQRDWQRDRQKRTNTVRQIDKYRQTERERERERRERERERESKKNILQKILQVSIRNVFHDKTYWLHDRTGSHHRHDIWMGTKALHQSYFRQQVFLVRDWGRICESKQVNRTLGVMQNISMLQCGRNPYLPTIVLFSRFI